MSKEREITRTINTVNVTLLCVNKEEGLAEDKLVILSGINGKNKEALLRLAQKRVPAPWQAVLVKGITEEEHLYAMSEEKFMALAEVRPVRESKSDAD